MSRYLCALLSALPLTAAADSIEIHGLSRHFGYRSTEFNERNVGIGYRHTLSDVWSVGGHVYENSFSGRAWGSEPAKRRVSAALVAEWTPIALGPVSAGLGGGLVTGYPSYPVLPGGYIVGRLKLGQAEVTIRGVPRIPNITRGIAAMSVGFSF